jgi:hypothetical protein
MVRRRRLPSLFLTFVLVAGQMLSLPLWFTPPAAGAPVPAAGSWTDYFDSPDEWTGISSSENATIERGSVVPGWSVDTGTGADGDLQAGRPTYTDSVRTSLAGNVQAEGSNFLPVNDSYGFSAGDELLVIQMTGSTAGTWEFGRVSETGISRLTLTAPVRHSYVASSTSRAQVLRVPNWRAVTVLAGCALTCAPWDGATGGIICFRASGELGVGSGGAIEAAGKGFSGGGTTNGASGGAGGAGGAGGGQAANGDPGGSAGSGGAGGNGGSGGGGRRGGTGGTGGGTGAEGAKGGAGKPGQASTGSGASSGQGGTNRGTPDLASFQIGSGGGGGAGGNGGAGAGGGGGGGGANNAGAAGTAGSPGGSGGTGAAGGTGGGAIMIIARDIRVEGVIRANGTGGQKGLSGLAGSAGGAGGNGDNGGGAFPYFYEGGGGGGGNGAPGGQGGQGGGGGGGGSVWLSAFSLSLGQNLVTALGGGGGQGGLGGGGGAIGAGGARGGDRAWAGSPGSTGPVGTAGNPGSAGGAGRIRLDSMSSAGAVSPAPFIAQLSRRDHASVVSVPVAPASLAWWTALSVEYVQPGTSGLTFQLLDAVNGSLLGEWLSSGEGRESFNLSAIAGVSVRLRADLYAAGADAPSLDSWALQWSPNRPPAAPAELSVDGQLSGSPGALNITSRAPVFQWRFSDNDTGQDQGAFNLSVWSGPGGTGKLMWRLQKDGPAGTATYGTGPVGAPLEWGADYFVTVSTRDAPLAGPLWGPASEMRFHLNGPPAAPGLAFPPDGAAAVSRPVELSWNASVDAEGGALGYEWEVSSDAAFGSLRAGGTTNDTRASVDLAANARYFWRVRASDGFSSSNWSPAWSFTVSSNRPPTVVSPPRMALFFGETRELNLTGFGSDPEEGQNLTWQAALTGGPGYGGYPPPLVLEVAGRTLKVTAGSVEGMFNVTLKAFDSLNATGTGTLFVTVSYTPPNRPPRLSFNGSSITGGKILRIDLLKIVQDEEPSTLRWEVLANNSLLRTQITGNTLELAAGNPKTNAQVLVRLRVRDRYNLSDESNAIFTVKAVKGAAAEGFPVMWAVGAVVAIIAVLALVLLVLSRRGQRVTGGARPAAESVARAADGGPRAEDSLLRTADRGQATAEGGTAPAPAPVPPPEEVPEEEVVQMDEEQPAAPIPAAAAYAPARAMPPRRTGPAAWSQLTAPPAYFRQPPRPGPAGPPRPPGPQFGPPARAPRPPQPGSIPPAEPLSAEPAADDLPVLEELEPVKPESRVQAPRPTKSASDLEEILSMLGKKR